MKDAYSFDGRYEQCWDENWRETDDFFFDNPELAEALRRIREYEGLREIRVLANSNLIAPKNYESVGFVLYDRKENSGGTAFAGDYLYYRIQLQ